jgi:hypothetical protein
MTDVSPNLFVGNPLCDKCLGHHPMNWDCQADKPSLIPTPVSPETMTSSNARPAKAQTSPA